jgi:ubiquinone biosynthesis protein Coq4
MSIFYNDNQLPFIFIVTHYLSPLEKETSIDHIQLFNELDEDDRQTVLKIVDKMLTTKKFNEFFEKNLKK